MTLRDYRHLYTSTAPGREKSQALALLIGAERALAKLVAPRYFAAKDQHTSLIDTGEYHAFYGALDTVDLDGQTVETLAPTGDSL